MNKNISILAVDLDGTLLRSDALHESLWSAVGRNWLQPFAVLRQLMRGRALLKRHLAQAAPRDVTTWPYNADVIAYIRRFREDGGRTVLVTATDQQIAEEIAAHLGLFDEVYGSDGTTNLKAEAKRRFLDRRYGEGKYAYMGDSAADLKIWPHAGRAITVNASPALRAQVENVGAAVEHLACEPATLGDHLQALRPHQWLKNVLVFLPMLTAQAFTLQAFLASLAAFVSFSMIASSAYVMNDLLDLAADRVHPRKCTRPFASGRLPITRGTWMAAGLFLGGLALAAAVSAQLFLVVLAYYLLTTAYSIVLKRRMIIDICVLAGLYTIRILAGAAATGLGLSVWILAFSVFLFFALAAVKRQAELVDTLKRGKLETSGRGYHVDDLPIISVMAIGAGFVSVLVMALYLNTPQVQALYKTPELLWGICCVLLYWISRTVMIAHRGWMHDDPVVFAARDRISQICFALILLFTFGAIWL